MILDIMGKYNFVHCNNCEGPILGHNENKCREIGEHEVFHEEIINKYEKGINNLDKFRKAIKNWDKMREIENKERMR